jgi:predicted NodU family carbamoyl transferase
VVQLNDNKIVAWMHGRMEFGARSGRPALLEAAPRRWQGHIDAMFVGSFFLQK